MKIPKTLKVGGITYKVIKRSRFSKGDSKFSGLAKHSQATVELALDFEDVPFDIQKVEECFIHELLHCVDNIYNNQKLDEDTVDRLSQGLYQVLKDNNLLKN